MDEIQLSLGQHGFVESMASLQINSQQIFGQMLPNIVDNNSNQLIMESVQQSPKKLGSSSPKDKSLNDNNNVVNGPIIYQEDENEKKRLFDPPLSMQRYTFVMRLLQSEINVKSVTDLGSGNCRLMFLLKGIDHLETCNFVEVNNTTLDFEAHYNAQPLPWDLIFGRPGTLQDLQVNIYQGDMTNPDSRLQNSDVITLVEVIEHLHPDVLARMPVTIFGVYKPKLVVITTPNREFNSIFFGDDMNKLRHWDHKFEWTRAEFHFWCSNVVRTYPDYTFELDGVGHILPASQELGPCTQIAIFRKIDQGSSRINACGVSMETVVGSFNLGETLNLHSSYIYPGQKIKPQEPDDSPIDWSLAT